MARKWAPWGPREPLVPQGGSWGPGVAWVTRGLFGTPSLGVPKPRLRGPKPRLGDPKPRLWGPWLTGLWS